MRGMKPGVAVRGRLDLEEHVGGGKYFRIVEFRGRTLRIVERSCFRVFLVVFGGYFGKGDT